jgi:hypothetical protein
MTAKRPNGQGPAQAVPTEQFVQDHWPRIGAAGTPLAVRPRRILRHRRLPSAVRDSRYGERTNVGAVAACSWYPAKCCEWLGDE